VFLEFWLQPLLLLLLLLPVMLSLLPSWLFFGLR
jgi:hypothetical protein